MPSTVTAAVRQVLLLICVIHGTVDPLASLVAQTVKRLPAVQETQLGSLAWEDSLEKEMATHSSILAWKIAWVEEPGGLQSMGSQRAGHDRAASLPFPSRVH